MDNNRKTETFLTVGNTAGLIFFSLYFYRTQSHMQAQISQISDALASVARAVSELKVSSSKSEKLTLMLKSLHDEVSEIDSRLERMPSASEFREFARQLNAIADGVEDAGISIPQVQEYDRSSHKDNNQDREDRNPQRNRNSQSRHQEHNDNGPKEQNNRRRIRFESPQEEDEEDIDSAIQMVRNNRTGRR